MILIACLLAVSYTHLAHKKVASTGNKPGVTKSNTWLKTKYNMVILDTPGVLWPKMDDKLVAYNLAATGAIRLEVLPINDVAYHLSLIHI